ncbi:hypothetical protein [Argonema antarcticum]|nr:hypothetical protein [Argonema antarcticum]MCL1470772.1 hypothetical protein [Argonema antarcticum A004/B2]
MTLVQQPQSSVCIIADSDRPYKQFYDRLYRPAPSSGREIKKDYFKI